MRRHPAGAATPRPIEPAGGVSAGSHPTGAGEGGAGEGGEGGAGKGAAGKGGKGVLRQSSLTSLIALVAVLSGLGLDLTVAAAFGAGRETDAFVVAARLPLGLAAVVMVMANQALVPSFTTWMTSLTRVCRRRVESAILLGVVAVAVLLALVLTLAARPLAHAMAPGFDEDQITLAAQLSQVMVWYVPCVAGAEVLRSWLNSRMSFVVPAAMTLILNLVAVGAIAVSARTIETVAWAYVGGSLAQVTVLALAAHRGGMRLNVPDFGHPELRRTAAMCVRPALGAGLNPLVRVVELFFASFLPTGSATVLHYGNRLASAIGGTIVFRSVIVALLPRLTRSWARVTTSAGATADAARAQFDHLLRLGLRIMLVVSLPMGALGAVLAPQAASAVFGVGRFDAASAALLGGVLAIYAFSFPGSGLQRALLSAAFARRDTVVPWRNTLYGALANVILLPLLVLPFGGQTTAVYGVAAAYSLAQYVNVAHAWSALRRRVSTDFSPVRADAVRTILGSLAGAAAAALAVGLLPDRTRPLMLASVLVAGLVGLAAYAAVLLTDARVRAFVGRGLPRRLRRPSGSGSGLPLPVLPAPRKPHVSSH